MKTQLAFFTSILFAACYSHATQAGLLCDPGAGANAANVIQQSVLSPRAQGLDCTDELRPIVNPAQLNIRRVELANYGFTRLYTPLIPNPYPYNATTGVFRFALHPGSMTHQQQRKIMHLGTFDGINGVYSPYNYTLGLGGADIYIQETIAPNNQRSLNVLLHLENQFALVEEYSLGTIQYLPYESDFDYRFKINVSKSPAGMSIFSLECLKAYSQCQYNNVQSAGPVATQVIVQEDAYFQFAPTENDLNPPAPGSDNSPKLVVKLVW
jgi:hypothetical protein